MHECGHRLARKRHGALLSGVEQALIAAKTGVDVKSQTATFASCPRVNERTPRGRAAMKIGEVV